MKEVLRQLQIQNFRCFDNHNITFEDTSIVVGKNNAGKSTVVDALLLLSAVVNRKGGKFVQPPRWLELPRFKLCIAPRIEHLGLNLTTIFHRYGEPPARITATFSNGARVTIYIGREETIYATVEAQGNWITSPRKFMGLSLPWIYVLPQVGPLQTEETLLTDAYVEENLYSRLSSRHFRNQVGRNADAFREFKRLAESTWQGLRVHPIERKATREGTVLSMLVQDGDFVAEVGWMGHGLQMWLQTIWFISRTPDGATIVLDEPDVYMHPDLQRKLFRFVRARFTQSIIATHSVEIMAEAEPGNILIVDKSKRRSRYATSDPGVQALIDQIGGMHNVHIARLWSAKKFMLVEGKDLSILRRFHALLYPEAEAQLDAVPNMPIGGWGGWHYAIGSAMTIENAIGDRITTYCILDSDYHTPAQIQRRYAEAADRGIHLHIWAYKELENYLLNPTVIQRVIGTRIQTGLAPSVEEVRQQMLTFCEDEKDTSLMGSRQNSLPMTVAWAPVPISSPAKPSGQCGQTRRNGFSLCLGKKFWQGSPNGPRRSTGSHLVPWRFSGSSVRRKCPAK